MPTAQEMIALGADRYEGDRSKASRVVSLVVVLALASGVAVAWVLSDRSARTYSVSENAATWTADVKTAIAERTPTGPVTPTGSLREIPGVGKIVSVVVEGQSAKRVTVLFLTVNGWNTAGLAYVKGSGPPWDTCNIHLSGPWWEIGQLNVSTMACARGLHFTGAG